MSSRAALLLQREQYRLSKEHGIWGVTAQPVENDLFHWQAIIEGLPDTPWEGGRFKLEMFFDDEYNEKPPEVFFMTVPFHPNVDMHTGKPCISFLEDPMEWEPETRISQLLMFLQALLANPGLDYPVNIAAAEIYQTSPRLYDQLVRDCVVASRRVEAGMVPFEGEEGEVASEEGENLESYLPIPAEPEVVTLPMSKSVVQTVSFEQYYDHWKGLATSVHIKPGSHTAHSRLPAELMIARDAVGGKVTEEQFREMMQRQRDLWFGIFPPKKVKKPGRRDSREARVDAMRQLYRTYSTNGGMSCEFPKSNPATSSGANAEIAGMLKGTVQSSPLFSAGDLVGEPAGVHKAEDWELEADNLLTWTEQLEHSATLA
ncbi:ubiquitin-conjugating enzyme/RWD-like protein [Powellomyces hirtus]|nr:ubiquitin-conjugating enzyme/RWD-like protein [Powellomyces hirtus]